MNQTKELSHGESIYLFWSEFKEIQKILFEQPSEPLTDGRYILAGAEAEPLSVELNLYPSETGQALQPGVYAFAEYYVCLKEDGEWGSLDALADIDGYQGVITPTLTPTTTEDELRREMGQVLMNLKALF